MCWTSGLDTAHHHHHHHGHLWPSLMDRRIHLQLVFKWCSNWNLDKVQLDLVRCWSLDPVTAVVEKALTYCIYNQNKCYLSFLSYVRIKLYKYDFLSFCFSWTLRVYLKRLSLSVFQTKGSNVHYYSCLCLMVSTNFLEEKNASNFFFWFCFLWRPFLFCNPELCKQTTPFTLVAIETWCFHSRWLVPFSFSRQKIFNQWDEASSLSDGLHEHRCLVFYASFYIWIELQLCFFKTSWSWSLWPLTSAVMVQSL